MPIRPENRARYPREWKQIADAVRARAGNRCQWCGVRNYRWIVRDHAGNVSYESTVPPRAGETQEPAVRIILTVAHLDHRPENCERSNLAALCQRCHNRHDALERARNRARNQWSDRINAGQLTFDFTQEGRDTNDRSSGTAIRRR